MKILFLILSLIFLACQTKQKAKKREEEKLSFQLKEGHEISFWDSVSNKYELAIEQIKKMTIIDSVYFTEMNSESAFIGDTVFNITDSFRCAIITWDDRRNCIYKFLLVFSQPDKINTDYADIYSNCDRDESSPYFSMDYNLLSNSTFETIKTYIPEYSDSITSTEKTKWRINKLGKIENQY